MSSSESTRACRGSRCRGGGRREAAAARERSAQERDRDERDEQEVGRSAQELDRRGSSIEARGDEDEHGHLQDVRAHRSCTITERSSERSTLRDDLDLLERLGVGLPDARDIADLHPLREQRGQPRNGGPAVEDQVSRETSLSFGTFANTSEPPSPRLHEASAPVRVEYDETALVRRSAASHCGVGQSSVIARRVRPPTGPARSRGCRRWPAAIRIACRTGLLAEHARLHRAVVLEPGKVLVTGEFLQVEVLLRPRSRSGSP